MFSYEEAVTITSDESVDDSTDSEGSEGSDDVPPDSFPSTICSSQQLVSRISC